MAKNPFRIERDSLGTIEVPRKALWGAQTQRACLNFPISGRTMPRPFIRALGLIKLAAAEANGRLGGLDAEVADAIVGAARAVADGLHDEQFPVDVFQTGSGTSTNMNANEVIAHLATRDGGRAVHPNDDVNRAQSSNDVIPTAIHLSAALELKETLLPALRELLRTIERKGRQLRGVPKTGRTHLMDAMPLRFDQELSGWAQQIRNAIERLQAVQPRLHQIAQGATAVGTGVNADPRFAAVFARALSRHAGLRLAPAANPFEALSCQDTAAELSGQLKVLACALMKIANDLRWMNSGPLAGLGEIELPALQPGSSIMPGKVNPVIPEAVAMVAAQVIGNDATITVAAQSGNFQLNVMLPLVADNLLSSLTILAAACRQLSRQCIAGFSVRRDRIDQALARNPILVTALNPVIGYAAGAEIAKQAYREGRSVLDVARERSGLPDADLRRLLDPLRLTEGG
ncbi:MAG: class II fumarate hydratase [Nevskiales bacterium]|nr:class II fumarate hydratase [Nevskiales bacterium]